MNAHNAVPTDDRVPVWATLAVAHNADAPNPDIHNRRSIRLRGYNYSQAGLYFVTICCDERKCRFGRIENGEMIMNEYGIIAYNEWIYLTKRFAQIEMNLFQIMPNHMHGIIAISPHENHGAGAIGVGNRAGAIGIENRAGASPAPTVPTDDPVGATLAVAPNTAVAHNVAVAHNAIATTAVPPDRRVTVGDIVGTYKSLVANACLKIYRSNNQTMGKLWQRNYWEHIIRNEPELSRIRHYIENNPLQWEYDKLNGGSGNRVLEPRTEYGEASWMI